MNIGLKDLMNLHNILKLHWNVRQFFYTFYYRIFIKSCIYFVCAILILSSNNTCFENARTVCSVHK